jgi:hypothetical protein
MPVDTTLTRPLERDLVCKYIAHEGDRDHVLTVAFHTDPSGHHGYRFDLVSYDAHGRQDVDAAVYFDRASALAHLNGWLAAIRTMRAYTSTDEIVAPRALDVDPLVTMVDAAMVNALYTLEQREAQQDATTQRLAGIRSAIACARAAREDYFRRRIEPATTHHPGACS